MLNQFTTIFMNITTLKSFFQSKLFRKILWGLGVAVVALTIFQAGIFVGYRKASFSYRFGDNFHRTFGAPERFGMMGQGGPFGFPPRGEYTSGYGTTGAIVKINLPTIVVADVDKIEKVVTVTDKTIIRRFREDIKAGDLKVGDLILAIGSPNTSGQIDAKLIRIMPSVDGANVPAPIIPIKK